MHETTLESAKTITRTTMKYCSSCGATVDFRIPPGDTLPRHVCAQCGTIHYQNPKVVVGALAEWEDRILLCRRAIEPRHGMWTLPAGFMENDETTAEAAARETREEACARIEVGELYTLIDVPHISQVHIIYRARLLDLDFQAGEESLEVALFREEDIPWDQIAFRTIAMTLRHFFEDRHAGKWTFHTGSLAPPPEGWR
jgi:ADP-ribose pyrophosphatase YjhB (NUDIX family)